MTFSEVRGLHSAQINHPAFDAPDSGAHAPAAAPGVSSNQAPQSLEAIRHNALSALLNSIDQARLKVEAIRALLSAFPPVPQEHELSPHIPSFEEVKESVQKVRIHNTTMSQAGPQRDELGLGQIASHLEEALRRIQSSKASSPNPIQRFAQLLVDMGDKAHTLIQVSEQKVVDFIKAHLEARTINQERIQTLLTGSSVDQPTRELLLLLRSMSTPPAPQAPEIQKKFAAFVAELRSTLEDLSKQKAEFDSQVRPVLQGALRTIRGEFHVSSVEEELIPNGLEPLKPPAELRTESVRSLKVIESQIRTLLTMPEHTHLDAESLAKAEQVFKELTQSVGRLLLDSLSLPESERQAIKAWAEPLSESVQKEKFTLPLSAKLKGELGQALGELQKLLRPESSVPGLGVYDKDARDLERALLKLLVPKQGVPDAVRELLIDIAQLLDSFPVLEWSPMEREATRLVRASRTIRSLADNINLLVSSPRAALEFLRESAETLINSVDPTHSQIPLPELLSQLPIPRPLVDRLVKLEELLSRALLGLHGEQTKGDESGHHALSQLLDQFGFEARERASVLQPRYGTVADNAIRLKSLLLDNDVKTVVTMHKDAPFGELGIHDRLFVQFVSDLGAHAENLERTTEAPSHKMIQRGLEKIWQAYVAEQAFEARTQPAVAESRLVGFLENMVATQELLARVNPVMQAAGEPVFLLFPTILGGLYGRMELLVRPEELHIDDEHKRGGSSSQAFQRLQFKVTLPNVGLISVDLAHRADEIFILCKVEHEVISTFIEAHLAKLEFVLRSYGYSRHSVQVTHGPADDIRPNWVRELLGYHPPAPC